MTKQELQQNLYQRYIRPTENKTDLFIGAEIEMPIVNLNYQAVDFRITHLLTKAFLKEFEFTVSGIDDDGNIYAAEDKIHHDVFSYDCSYNNLELSFGKEKDLNQIYRRFLKYYQFIQKFLFSHHHMLTGMGINPFRKLNHNLPIENGRYKMLYHHLLSYPKYASMPMHFHQYPNFGMFSSASQVQLDVCKENIAEVINTFGKLEPIKALLFANSVLLEENEELLCCRDMLWENSTHGINPHNIGMYQYKIQSPEDWLQYISTASIYCVEREGHYINFKPTNLTEYFNTDVLTGEYADNGKVYSVKFHPEENDLSYLRTFKFEDLTFRGTIEFRSVCCQPISDVMTVSAFHLGLMGKLEELSVLLENDDILYHNGYNASELRKILTHSKMPEWINMDKLYELTYQILELCKEGLLERQLGEEIYLQPLYERVKERSNPARTMLKKLKNGESIFSVIQDFAKEN